jgi:hypothetical protein
MKYITFTNLNEEKLSSKERNQLPDEAFGIPSLRKFPIHDKSHVMDCIKKFNYVDQEHEAELARNVIKKMKEYNIPPETVGEKNRLRKYL